MPPSTPLPTPIQPPTPLPIPTPSPAPTSKLRIFLKIVFALLVACIPFALHIFIFAYAFGCKYGNSCDASFLEPVVRMLPYLYVVCGALALAIILPKKLKKTRWVITILAVVFLIIQAVSVYGFGYSVVQQAQESNAEDACSKFPEQVLVNYCRMPFEVKKKNSHACDLISTLPQSYYDIRDDKQYPQLGGFAGVLPMDEKSTLQNQNTCYRWVMTMFTDDENGQIKNAKAYVDCQSLTNEDARNACFFKLGARSGPPQSEVLACESAHPTDRLNTNPPCSERNFGHNWRVQACGKVSSEAMSSVCLKAVEALYAYSE